MSPRSPRWVPLGFMAIASVVAVPAGAGERGWSWSLTPSLWRASVHADGAIRDPVVLEDNTLNVSDLVDESGFSTELQVEGRNGRHGVHLDAEHLDLGSSQQLTRVGGITTPSLETTSDLELTLVEAAGLFNPLGDGTGWSLLYGARFLDVTTSIDAHHLGSTDAWDYEARAALFDGLLGFRYQGGFSDRWSFELRADVAAGGTDLTVNALLGCGLSLDAAGTYTLNGGYRYLRTKLVAEDGPAEVALEPNLGGFFLGLTIRL